MRFPTTLGEPIGLHYIFPQFICLAAGGWVRILSGNKGIKSSRVTISVFTQKVSSSHYTGCVVKLEEMGFLKVGLSWLVVEVLRLDREKHHNSDQK